MRRRNFMVIIFALALLGSLWIAVHKTPSGELLSTRFLSISNAPDGEVLGIFEVVNSSHVRPIRFHTLEIEEYTALGWVPFYPTNEWAGLNSWNLAPGRHLMTIVWPPGLSTNSVWQLHLACAKEPYLPLAWANKLLHTELFKLREMPSTTCVVRQK